MYTLVMSKQVSLFVRVPEEIRDAMQAWADEEDRPLGKHVTRVLRDALVSAGRLNPQHPAS